ncbi:MAG: Pvc16 family protein, partial [Gammaproteobacteria bacterium]
MLRDVDISLAAWLSGFLPPGTDVVFDLPSFDGPSARPDDRVVLALHLHDVREEGELTPGDWNELRNDEGRLVGRLPPQRRYRLTYLLTAWAADTLDEHELLGTVLAG